MNPRILEHYFANKGSYCQSYGCSSSHVWMWELDHEEGWASKNWCFQTVVLEKTLENSLGYKEIKPVNPRGNQPWIFIGMSYPALYHKVGFVLDGFAQLSASLSILSVFKEVWGTHWCSVD